MEADIPVDFNPLSLLDAEIYPHPVAEVEHIETHISHIFLTGDFAYKVKKTICLPFLDFSTLKKREQACLTELKLNKRFAPEIYLDVVPVYCAQGRASFQPMGPPVEYAVKMKQFDNSTLLSTVLKEGRFTRELAVDLAGSIATFHHSAAQAPGYWSEATIRKLTSDNISVCLKHNEIFPEGQLAELQRLLNLSIASHSDLIARRQHDSVKELHGDLHLRNVFIHDGKPTLFDGIEFNKLYSCCDVWADIAFLIMDLLSKDRSDLGFAVINRYLELTDDFEGVKLLPLYLSYRAAVRAKVACIRLSEAPPPEEQATLRRSAARYIKFALEAVSLTEPYLIAIGGLSGSGKTTLARSLAEDIGAIHIRSDVVRKHLLGLAPEEPAPPEGYSKEVSTSTYHGLLERTSASLQAGYPTIVDAVFARSDDRQALKEYAKLTGIALNCFWCEVDAATAKERITDRAGDASDATVAVYNRQQADVDKPIDWQTLDTEKDVLAITEQVKDCISRIQKSQSH